MANETQKHFDRVAGQLDTIIEQITPFLASREIEIKDWSNRSGNYDGFRSWCCDFERRETDGMEIQCVKTSISYQEPVGLLLGDDVTIRTTAERFYRGKKSHWKKVTDDSVPVSQISESQLRDVIIAELSTATHTLKRSIEQGADDQLPARVESKVE